MKVRLKSFLILAGLILLLPVLGVSQSIAPATSSPIVAVAGTGYPDLSAAAKAEVLLASVKGNALPSIRATLKVMPENWEQVRVHTVG